MLNPSLWDPETIVDDNHWLQKHTHIYSEIILFTNTFIWILFSSYVNALDLKKSDEKFLILKLYIAVQMHVDFQKTSYFRFEPLPTFSIEEKKIHFFRELWPFWQIFPPTFFFFLKNLFSLPLSTHFIGGLYRFDFCNRCEMVDDLQQNNMKRKNLLKICWHCCIILPTFDGRSR